MGWAKIPILVILGGAFVGARTIVQVNNDLYNRWLGTSLGKRAENRQVLGARAVVVAMSVGILLMSP